MLEYVLFGQLPYEKFLVFVKAKGVEVETLIDGEIFQVSTPENLDEETSKDIEDYYEQMMALNQTLFDAENEGSDNFESAGVIVSLKDGTTAYADVNGSVLARIMKVLTAEEFATVVESIVEAVDKPDNRPLCKRG